MNGRGLETALGSLGVAGIQGEAAEMMGSREHGSCRDGWDEAATCRELAQIAEGCCNRWPLQEMAAMAGKERSTVQ